MSVSWIWLKSTQPLAEAGRTLQEPEPLMRRHLVIFLAFQRETGHARPHRDASIRNHSALLSEIGRDQASVDAEIADAWCEAGLA
jgi:hypothetical protein